MGSGTICQTKQLRTRPREEGGSRVRRGRPSLNLLQWDALSALSALRRQLDPGLRGQIWARDINWRLSSDCLVNCSSWCGKAVQDEAWDKGRRPINCMAQWTLMTFTGGRRWRSKCKERKQSRRSQTFALSRYSWRVRWRERREVIATPLV